VQKFATGIVDTDNKFAKVAGCACFFKSANFWAQSAIAIPQISEICESPNFKSANFVGEPVCKFSTIRQRELNFFKNSLSLYQNYLKVVSRFVSQNFLFDKIFN
jgi:hypothetical protein